MVKEVSISELDVMILFEKVVTPKLQEKIIRKSDAYKKVTKKWRENNKEKVIRAVLSNKPNGFSRWMDCEIQNRKVFIF
jgi:hypothetical protein